ncbi:hypothetical protein LCGC14_1619620 [marine sediment metagenome]|uniref:Uncharacterized protein n=1 Tax=marine sediment metagenome TaxID=412755 RepID=A0A0F9ISQ3_9ZZZZ
MNGERPRSRLVAKGGDVVRDYDSRAIDGLVDLDGVTIWLKR